MGISANLAFVSSAAETDTCGPVTVKHDPLRLHGRKKQRGHDLLPVIGKNLRRIFVQQDPKLQHFPVLFPRTAGCLHGDKLHLSAADHITVNPGVGPVYGQALLFTAVLHKCLIGFVLGKPDTEMLKFESRDLHQKLHDPSPDALQNRRLGNHYHYPMSSEAGL